MRLDKLLGSQAKADILKFLVFKREGISARALENYLSWSFPSIKKQIDMLESIWILTIDKNHQKWEIFLTDSFKPLLKEFLMNFLKWETQTTFEQYSWIDKYFLGKIFNPNLKVDVDLVIVHQPVEDRAITALKEEINSLFASYFLDNILITFMPASQFELRYKMADKFVLSLLQASKS